MSDILENSLNEQISIPANQAIIDLCILTDKSIQNFLEHASCRAFKRNRFKRVNVVIICHIQGKQANIAKMKDTVQSQATHRVCMIICNTFDRFDTIAGVKGVNIEIGTLVPFLLIT